LIGSAGQQHDPPPVATLNIEPVGNPGRQLEALAPPDAAQQITGTAGVHP
jgi:hypothetical protein